MILKNLTCDMLLFLHFLFYSNLEDISEMSKIPREGKNHTHSDLTFIEILVGTFQLFIILRLQRKIALIKTLLQPQDQAWALKHSKK